MGKLFVVKNGFFLGKVFVKNSMLID